jgi:hypothetical protein
MATRQVSTRTLVGLKSLSFIRPQRVTFNTVNTKPSTRLYPFFDGVPVDQYITPTGGVLGGSIVTNTAGEISGTFDIPPMTFNTGDREFKLQDDPLYSATIIPGSTIGYATSSFYTSGLQESYQTTINTITQNVVEITASNDGGGDPLAQTFFTYGVTGGCFITAIDIFFQSKDSSIPVTVELRETQNGYPAGKRVSRYSTVTLAPSSVVISQTAASPTKFTFSRPIYLEENKDYCFVLLANTNKYNVWTSKLGETSIETGKTIFEQPFVGSMFKSENNVTWTAEQTEDIKFTLYKAQFATGTSELTFKATAAPTLVYGSNFSVISGSPAVTCKLPFQHSFRTGDKVFLTGNTLAAYRGISNTAICDVLGFAVTAVDDYTFTFSAGASATSTGTLASSGGLDRVDVDLAGSGYVSPSISFNGGGGTGAAATPVVVGGKIVSVTVTSRGTGYTSTPNLVLSDVSGSGALLTPISETIFSALINRPYQNFVPIVTVDAPPDTSISNSVRTSSKDYVVSTFIDAPLNRTTLTQTLNAVVTPDTETTNFGTSSSTQMITQLETTNSNVSPVVDMGEVPRIKFNNFIVNGKVNAASELTPKSGTAQSKYISKKVTIKIPSKDIRIMVNAASIESTSFGVFVRTSLSSSVSAHEDLNWVELVCATLTNTSPTWDKYRDYEFSTVSGLPVFDVYDVKIVLYSENKTVFPKINSYSAIVLAT